YMEREVVDVAEDGTGLEALVAVRVHNVGQPLHQRARLGSSHTAWGEKMSLYPSRSHALSFRLSRSLLFLDLLFSLSLSLLFQSPTGLPCQVHCSHQEYRTLARAS